MLLELLTYRRTGHSRRDACHYQPQEERDAWFAQDPIERFAQVLKAEGWSTMRGWRRSGSGSFSNSSRPSTPRDVRRTPTCEN